uniref:G-protein coupled receptor Mth-like 1 n=1 Tax=Timema cristinae TaxID=61476 RepID=A0A7R9CL49_TIMCR|nr:unnamed protein product [Timema cristinae]
MLWPALLLLLPGGQGVRIYKCCSLDQRLDPGGECVSTPGAEWLPLVYSPGKKGFLPQGEMPALWEVEAGHLPSCSEPLAAHQDSPELPALLMFENGSLWLHESGGLVEPGLFCVDSGAALVCPSHPTVPGSVRKCCGEDAAWSESKGSCVSWSQGALNLSGPVVAGFPPCHGPQMGYVVSPLPDHLPAADYCVEYVLDQGPSLVTCDVPATDHQLRFSLYPAGLLVSCVFLAATLAAGCLLPASHHAIHWRCQTCHVACLLAGYLLLAIVQLGGHNAPPLLCSTLGIGKVESTFAWRESGKPFKKKKYITPPVHPTEIRTSISPVLDSQTQHEINAHCHALLLSRCIFLAQHYVFQHLVDIQHSVVLPIRIIRLRTNYANGLGIGKVEFRGCEPSFAGREGGNLLGEDTSSSPHQDSNLDLPVLDSLAQHDTSADFRPSSLDKLQEVCRLRLYQVYAWGVPLIIAGVAALVDNLPPSHNSLLRPRFGQRTCWFYELPCAVLSPAIKRNMTSFVLTDPTFDTPAPIDILLGADLFAQIMTGEQYILRKDLPIAFGTVFGVALMGPTPCSTASVPQDHFNGVTTLLSINDIDLHSSLQNFWKLEELSLSMGL